MNKKKSRLSLKKKKILNIQNNRKNNCFLNGVFVCRCPVHEKDMT
jgi:hypothetical protein